MNIYKQSVFIIAVLLSAAVALSSCSSPVVKAGATQEGLASFYGKEFNGRKTSSGEIFDMYKMTAAHRTYPFGTIVRVTNLKDGSQVDVKVNDRGPVKPERIIDLSYSAAKSIGLDKLGLVRVRLEVLDWGK
ncbi:MAG TPA: septal ring lytic transglycosylase RlpA family protein [Candidatus Kapabacteria bacterium]|nr:septal ring lytic transglycosylase RlpA family protein [Candidatus Kapabacteria bacterium]